MSPGPTLENWFYDVYRWKEDAPEYVINLWNYFQHPMIADRDLIYSIPGAGAVNPDLVSSLMINGNTGDLTIAFAALNAGSTEVTVRATDPCGRYVEDTFKVFVVEVVDYSVESQLWSDPGEPWEATLPDEGLWEPDAHRWTPEFLPNDADIRIDAIEWVASPWSSLGDPNASWWTFATAPCVNESPSCLAIGSPGAGNWAVTPRISFGGGEAVAMLQQPKQQPEFRISAVEWVGVNPGDGSTNLDMQLNRIFPERNHPQGSPNDQPHDKITVKITITPPVPVGWQATVHWQVFDPDHALDGAPVDSTAPYSDGADPNDFNAGAHEPDDNLNTTGQDGGGPGMLPVKDKFDFAAGVAQCERQLTIEWPQPGNNFIVAAHHREDRMNRYRFRDDGTTLSIANATIVFNAPPNYQSSLLTVWRTLWVEVDSMEAPANDGSDGAFTGDAACLGCDDERFDPREPDTGLMNLYEAAFVRVDVLDAVHDPRNDLEFYHNKIDDNSANFGISVRDVFSTPSFLVVHVVGAYEHHSNNDYDPNDEAASWLGWAFIRNGDGPNLIYLETIRDRQLNDPAGDPVPVDRAILEQRVVLHESLHRFVGWHGEKGADDGIMAYHTCLYGDDTAIALTPYQIRKIQGTSNPK